jgi:hypothetical protein
MPLMAALTDVYWGPVSPVFSSEHAISTTVNPVSGSAGVACRAWLAWRGCMLVPQQAGYRLARWFFLGARCASLASQCLPTCQRRGPGLTRPHFSLIGGQKARRLQRGIEPHCSRQGSLALPFVVVVVDPLRRVDSFRARIRQENARDEPLQALSLQGFEGDVRRPSLCAIRAQKRRALCLLTGCRLAG